MSAHVPSPPPGRDPSLALESFARDLLALVRGVRVYPEAHPYLQDVVGRLLAGLHRDLPDPLSLAVLPAELNAGDAYAGGRNTRAAHLAAFLHGKKVLRMHWTREATPGHAAAFAGLLADPGLEARGLQQALDARGVHTIGVDALDLARLHDTFSETSHAPETGQEGRRRVAWAWLLRDSATPQEIAAAMSSESFWTLDREGGGRDEAASLGQALVALGGRLRDALDTLPPERRAEVEERLARLGGRLRAEDLAVMLRAAERHGGLRGPAVSALTQDLSGERLVELLGALAAAEGKATQRLADVFRRFAPPGGAAELLPVVQARLAHPERGPLATGVWKAVEDFLLDLHEDPFMGADYAASLDRLASGEVAQGSDDATPYDLLEDAEGHLDRVLVSLAAHEQEPWATRVLERLASRGRELPPSAYLALLESIHRATPGLLERRPEVLERAFREGTDRLRDLDGKSREQLLAFALAHEESLLDPVLRSLGSEERISVRRFLVEVLSAFSPWATPAIVARLRNAPWYVTRNLAIALGRRKDPRALPALRSLLGHGHAKVRREAALALGRFEEGAAGPVSAGREPGRICGAQGSGEG